MILVNRNFGNPVLSSVIGDMFKGSSDTGQNVAWVPHSNNLVGGSSLVSVYSPDISLGDITNYNSTCNNFYLVTEHFLKTLDKVYTKIWNESFTETGIYYPVNLVTIYHGFTINRQLTSSNTDFMIFKKFVDRCISAGILVEADRLQYEDQIFLSGMSRTNMSTQIDLANKLITLTNSTPIDVAPDINAMTGQYLAGKKLFLMVTPYLTNYNVERWAPDQAEAIKSWVSNQVGPVRQPLAFFKPKTDASKFGRSLPLSTHFFWSIGTPEEKALAETNGTTPPDLIFDHLNRISHIDSLVLKIKFDKLQF